MAPVRIKLYGLIRMTRRTYLTLQAVGLVLLLGLLVAGAVAMVRTGAWLPQFDVPKNAPEGWWINQSLIGLFWVALVTLLLEGVETFVVLGKFARAEAQERVRQAALAPAAPAAPAADASEAITLERLPPGPPADGYPP